MFSCIAVNAVRAHVPCEDVSGDAVLIAVLACNFEADLQRTSTACTFLLRSIEKSHQRATLTALREWMPRSPNT